MIKNRKLSRPLWFHWINYEIEEIIDHCKQDKQLNFWEFMTQINEQDKAFKKLKKENNELKKEKETG